MLILTRRIGEKIKIGDDIDVVVLGITGGQVRLGVTAPSDVSVHREEIYKRIELEMMDIKNVLPSLEKEVVMAANL